MVRRGKGGKKRRGDKRGEKGGEETGEERRGCMIAIPINVGQLSDGHL